MADEKHYVVTGAYVTVKTNTPDGPRIVGRYAGAPVPADAPAEWIEHHVKKGLIREVPGPAPATTGALEEQGAPEPGDNAPPAKRPAPPPQQRRADTGKAGEPGKGG